MRLFVIAMLALLAGCAGYQYGAVTATALERQAAYCEAADPYQRAVRKAALTRLGVPVPDEGACTDLLMLLEDED